MNTDFIKELEYINFHTKNSFKILNVQEIRIIKVLKKSNMHLFDLCSVCSLFFLSNDFLDFDKNGLKTDNLTIYSVKMLQSKEIFILGILIEYFKDGTKKESLYCSKKINKITYMFLKSKYDILWYIASLYLLI